MIHPAPTTAIDPRLARGVLAETGPITAGKPERIVIEFPNTNYRLELVPTGPMTTQVGKRIIGTIHAQARRIDVVDTGGRYVEPVYGTPRRVQGAVIAVQDNAIVVNAGMPIHCTPTDPRQKASDFALGALVSFDVLPGATFSAQP